MSKKEDQEFNELSKRLAKELRSGKKLTGKDGAITPLIKTSIRSCSGGGVG